MADEEMPHTLLALSKLVNEQKARINELEDTVERQGQALDDSSNAPWVPVSERRVAGLPELWRDRALALETQRIQMRRDGWLSKDTAGPADIGMVQVHKGFLAGQGLWREADR